MSGQATLIGSLSVGQLCPLLLASQAQLTANVNVLLPQIQAQITGLLALQANLVATPPNIASMLAQAEALVAAILAAIAQGIPPVSLQITAVAAALAQLNVTLGQLTASLTFAAGFPLGATGIAAYAYTGTVGAMGSAITAAMSSGLPGGMPTDNCNAIVLATENPATWASMQVVFKTQ